MLITGGSCSLRSLWLFSREWTVWEQGKEGKNQWMNAEAGGGQWETGAEQSATFRRHAAVGAVCGLCAPHCVPRGSAQACLEEHVPPGPCTGFALLPKIRRSGSDRPCQGHTVYAHILTTKPGCGAPGGGSVPTPKTLHELLSGSLMKKGVRRTSGDASWCPSLAGGTSLCVLPS